MKRFLFVCATAIALVVGVQSKAEAAVATQLHICQGATCVDFFGASFVVGGVVPVGDYLVIGALGGTTETSVFSQSQTVTLNVRRVAGTLNPAPLDVWLQATGFTLPAGPWTLDTTLGATSSPENPGAAIDYQAWLSQTNAIGFPPAGSTVTPEISCIPVAASGPGSCSTSGAPVLVSPGSALYSLTTRTQFNIGVGDSLIYGSTGQAVVTSVIPEPMSLMLLGSGLLGMATARRRLKK